MREHGAGEWKAFLFRATPVAAFLNDGIEDGEEFGGVGMKEADIKRKSGVEPESRSVEVVGEGFRGERVRLSTEGVLLFCDGPEIGR